MKESTIHDKVLISELNDNLKKTKKINENEKNFIKQSVVNVFKKLELYENDKNIWNEHKSDLKCIREAFEADIVRINEMLKESSRYTSQDIMWVLSQKNLLNQWIAVYRKWDTLDRMLTPYNLKTQNASLEKWEDESKHEIWSVTLLHRKHALYMQLKNINGVKIDKNDMLTVDNNMSLRWQIQVMETFRELISILIKENPVKVKEYESIMFKIDQSYSQIAKKLDLTPERIHDFKNQFETTLRDNLTKLAIPTEKIAEILRRTWEAFSRFSTPEKFTSIIIGPIAAWFWISSFITWAWAIIESVLAADYAWKAYLATSKAMEFAMRYPRLSWITAWLIPNSWKSWLWNIFDNSKYRTWFYIWWIIKDFRETIALKISSISKG